MCVMCEAEKLGVTENMLLAANAYLEMFCDMAYCAVSVGDIALKSNLDFSLRRAVLYRGYQGRVPEMEQRFAAMGLNLREYCWNHLDVRQEEWVECLEQVLTALLGYSMLYVKYMPPLSNIEGVLEIAERNAQGASLH